MHVNTSDQETLKLGSGGHTCNWGAHIAGLYETDEERDEIILGFLGEGVKAGDLQLYCPSERTVSDFKEKMTAKCPHCEGTYDNQEVFRFFSPRNLYYPKGTFSPEAMDMGLNTFYEASQSKGKRNIRATAEMSWALEAVPGREQLFAYEARLNLFIPGKPWVSICMYNLTKFSGEMIMQVLQTHPYTISKRGIVVNPYFQDPYKWLAANAPEHLPR